jgi:replicative DNA helicase
VDKEVVKGVPPHDENAETAVIGSILMDPDVILDVEDKIKKDDFYNPQYGAIYEAALRMFHNGEEVDVITVSDRLKSMNVPPSFSDVAFLSGIVALVPSAFNAGKYADIIWEKASLRRLIKASNSISSESYAAIKPVDQILNDAEKSIFDITQNRIGSNFENIGDVAIEVMDQLNEAYHNKSRVTGLSTGFTDLDNKTAGLQKSDLILVAARPAMGKTAFVLNIAWNAAKHGNVVAMFSLEMSAPQLAKRILSMETHVDSQKLRIGDLNDADWKSVVEGMSKMGSTNFNICADSGITLSEIRSKLRKLKVENHGRLDLVCIDYLQLMTSGIGRRSDSRQQEVSDISRGLKILAKELDVPIIALSQLSRAVESRENKHPMLSDLRESGAIEQDADIVMFIYRDEYYKKEKSEKKGIAEINIAKQRNGEVGTIELAWIGQYTKFANLDHSRS